MTFPHWLRNVLNRTAMRTAPVCRSRRSRWGRYPLCLETLEDRLAPAAAVLAFTTASQLVVAGQPSGTITVQLEDLNQQPVPAGPGGVDVNLSSSSFDGRFLDAAGNPLTNATVTIAQGSTSASFRYEDVELGTPTLTASTYSASFGVSPGTQQETIDADLIVTSANDAGPGTLRDAMLHAVSGNTIAFEPGLGDIQLQSQLPLITTNVNIVGPGGSRLLNIEGGGTTAANQGLFGVKSGATVVISDLRVFGSNSTGISNSGNLTLKRMELDFNSASSAANAFPYGSAGAVYNDGTLTVQGSTFSNNESASGLGAAGIDNELRGTGGGQATITDSTITGSFGTAIANNGTMTLTRVLVQYNHASGQGSFDGFGFGAPGGIYNGGTLTLVASTVDGNTTTLNHGVAAGIDSEAGALIIADSTISNNTANQTGGSGGIGIYQPSPVASTLLISNSTVTHNVTNDTNNSGGGIDSAGASVTIFDTIVAGNTGASANPTDVSGTFTSQGHNWIGTADSHSSGFVASDIVGTIANPQDPKLASALGDNNGPTPTFALLPGSRAIDAGDNTNAPPTDQRGFQRIAHGTIDIGAYEFQIVLTPGPLTVAQVGASYSQAISASFGTAPYTFAVTSGALPAGLSLATNGNIMGTPTAGGAFTFTVTATDSTPGTAYTGSRAYTLVVNPPFITFSPTPPGAPVNVAYSQQLTASGGTAPYSNFTVTAGQLPPGITLTPTGLLAGVPTTAGAYLFTVSVTDGSGGTGPYTRGQQLGILVTPPGFTYDAANKILTISSNASSNQFEYSQTTSQDVAGTIHTIYSFTLNGVVLKVPNVFLGTVSVSVSGHDTTAILVASDTYTGTDGKQHETSELAALGPGGGQLLHVHVDAFGDPVASTFLTLSGFLIAYAYVGRADSGTLTATAGGENIFVSAGGYSYITGVGQYYEVSGAPSIYGYSVNASDQAWHYDTAALSSFVASGNAFSYMSGTDTGGSYFNVAVGFDVTYGIATHNQSFAYLIDSPGNDVLVGYAPYSYLSGSDNAGSVFNVAEGFQLVYGESFVGGTDYAYNYSLNHNILSNRWILLT